MSESIFVKDLIRRVHQELLESQQEREKSGEHPIFEVESLTIEVNFVIVQSKEAKGEVGFKLITVAEGDLGGTKSYQQQQIQKITLSLTALPYDGMGSLKDVEGSSSRFMPRSE